MKDKLRIWVDIGALLAAAAVIGAVMLFLASLNPAPGPQIFRTSILAITMAATLLLVRICFGTGDRSTGPLRTVVTVFGGYLIWVVWVQAFMILGDRDFPAQTSWGDLAMRELPMLITGLYMAVAFGLFTIAVLYPVRWTARRLSRPPERLP